MEYWCINNNFKPKWVRELIDRRLLIQKNTPLTECYEFYQTTITTSPIYLYDGDGLCYCDNKIGVVYNLYLDFEKLKKVVPVVKYYCDMCGKEVFFKDNIKSLKLSEKYSSTKEYDICEDCYNKIKKMINRKDKD